MTALEVPTHLVDAGLIAQLLLGALAVLVAVAAPARLRSVLTGSVVVLAGIAAAVTGSAALVGAVGVGLQIPVVLPLAAPLEPLVLAPDRLGGLFMALA
ncbi:MAG: hypothetical protein WAS02_06190, partial [Propionicimonas sp.]